MDKKIIIDEDGIRRSLTRMSHEIIERNKGVDDLILVGIKTRGVYLAERISTIIEKFEDVKIPVYSLDVKAWRDDQDEKLPLPEVTFSVKDKKVVLIDDVLFKGRTVRAALEGILHHGRAIQIQLAVLVDRGHRELPIRADFVGKNIPTSIEENVQVMTKECDSCDAVVLERE